MRIVHTQKKRNVKSLLPFLAIFSMVISSCSTMEIMKEITVYDSDVQSKYVLQLRYVRKIRGNIHNLDMSQHEYHDCAWIYLNELSGEIVADSLVLCPYGQIKSRFSSSVDSLKGTLNFESDSIVVLKLALPYYRANSTIDHFEPYELNGRYQLRVKHEIPSFKEEDFSDPYRQDW